MKYDHLAKLGEVLKAWRLKRRLSAYKVSELAHINYRVLKNLEAGKEDVYLRSFIRYANYIESIDSEFNVWTYYKCWTYALDKDLNNEERCEKRSQIETWLKLAEPKGKRGRTPQNP
jgi:cytoskeletal protein RodZ